MQNSCFDDSEKRKSGNDVSNLSLLNSQKRMKRSVIFSSRFMSSSIYEREAHNTIRKITDTFFQSTSVQDSRVFRLL